MIANYHTHTLRCKHAMKEDEDYVLAAIDSGLTTLGFSDHCPWILKKDESSSIRMEIAELDNYVSSIRYLKDKYKDKIDILIGFECEYYQDRMGWLIQTAKDYKLDYLIFGNHYHEQSSQQTYFGRYGKKEALLEDYLNDSLGAIESGVFTYFAHPDLYMRGYYEWDSEAERVARIICEKAKEKKLPLEFNLGGIRANSWGRSGYPCPSFWQVAAKVGNEVIIGIDAHDPQEIKNTKMIEESAKYLKELGFNTIDKLDSSHFNKF